MTNGARREGNALLAKLLRERERAEADGQSVTEADAAIERLRRALGGGRRTSGGRDD